MQRSVIKEEACEKQVRVVRLLLGPPTLGPKETSFRTHSTVNMVVKMRFRSLRMSMNSSGAPWNWNNWSNGDTPTPKMSQSISWIFPWTREFPVSSLCGETQNVGKCKICPIISTQMGLFCIYFYINNKRGWEARFWINIHKNMKRIILKERIEFIRWLQRTGSKTN